MTAEELKAFKKSWEEYPSQDNEGYVPDRGGFKAGFMAGIRWEREVCAKIAEPKPGPGSMIENSIREAIAQAIRARSEGK